MVVVRVNMRVWVPLTTKLVPRPYSSQIDIAPVTYKLSPTIIAFAFS